jgi:hypothetical protein
MIARMRGGWVLNRGNRWLVKAIALAGLVALPGCDWVQDRFRECRHLQIDLENRGGSGDPVNLVLEGERYGNENLVPWLSSRRVEVCAERGDVKRFRAGRAEQTLSIANCVVTRPTYEYEFNVARVVFDRGELACENW